MTTRKFNVLFLCTHNTARSIMAEAILRNRAGDRFNAGSAGAEPGAAVHPMALRVLEQARLPTEGLRPKGWDPFTGPNAPAFDFVFTVCNRVTGEHCPPWEGQPITADWSVPDPAAAQGSDTLRMAHFQEAFRFLDNRIKIFVSLPIGSLDRLSLQKKVDEIGRLAPADDAGSSAA
jgi:arsenate reductase (thioredoxin)